MMQHDNDKKVHTHAFVRKVNSMLIRWRVQRRREKIRQSVLSTFLILLFYHVDFAKNIRYDLQNHPRTIYINESYYSLQPRKDSNYRVYRKVEPLSVVHVKPDHSESPFEEGNCKAMHHWQIENHSTCNPIHEISAMQEMQHLAKGGYRDVWWTMDGDGSDVVVKTLVWKKNPTKQREKDRHQRDANAYTALQSSKHIPKIYGYCEFKQF